MIRVRFWSMYPSLFMMLWLHDLEMVALSFLFDRMVFVLMNLTLCTVADDRGSHWRIEGADWVQPVCHCEVLGRQVQGCSAGQFQEDFDRPAAEPDEGREAREGEELV